MSPSINVCNSVRPNGVRSHTDVSKVGYVDKVFMNDTRFANEDAFMTKEALYDTLREWVALSSSRHPSLILT